MKNYKKHIFSISLVSLIFLLMLTNLGDISIIDNDLEKKPISSATIGTPPGWTRITNNGNEDRCQYGTFYGSDNVIMYDQFWTDPCGDSWQIQKNFTEVQSPTQSNPLIVEFDILTTDCFVDDRSCQPQYCVWDENGTTAFALTSGRYENYGTYQSVYIEHNAGTSPSLA